MAITKLRRMVLKDALDRLRVDNDAAYVAVLTEVSGTGITSLSVPSDKEIKENGYEGAVEQVYQQMVQLGQTA